MNNTTIIVDQPAWQAMTTSAIHTFPEECCGFIWGDERGGRVTLAREVNNCAEVNRHLSFSICSTDYLKAERLARRRNLRLLGVYHSHPGRSAYPSPHDIEVALPNLYYVIMGTDGSEVYDFRCWQLDESGRFTAKAIQILNPTITNLPQQCLPF